MVIGGYDIAHLRNMYFEVKDKVFGTPGDGTAFNTDALEVILKNALQDREMTELENGPKLVSSLCCITLYDIIIECLLVLWTRVPIS